MGGAMSFFDRLAAVAQRNDSLVCVGLDPTPDSLPPEVRGQPHPLYAFNCRIIDATRDLVCAYKLNSAFYEAEGLSGLEDLQRTIAYLGPEVPVILDVKRADIGSTAAAYARAAFDVFKAQAVTVNPYLGGDSLAPFTDRMDRGVFVLCHTSNPGAAELQELNCDGLPLYLHVARRAAAWSRHGNVGLVVGATYPEALRSVRRFAPEMWILVPGVGSQGGDLEASLAAGLRRDGLGLIVNASRSICQAADPRRAVLELRESINQTRETLRGAPPDQAAVMPIPDADKEAIALDLAQMGAVRFGQFTLKSGLSSPVYIDLRLLASYPRTLARVAQAYSRLLKPLSYDRLAAIPYAALPIGTAVSLLTDRPLIYPRKEVKSYGTGRAIEGTFVAGERAVVLDDLITTGASKLEAVEPLQSAGLVVEDIVVLIDRQGSGKAELARAGYRLHAVLTLTELVDILAAHGRIEPSQQVAVRDWLAGGMAS